MSASTRLPTGTFQYSNSPPTGSSSRQTPTAMGLTTGIDRLSTAKRPGSRTSWGGLVQGIGLATSISVVDRPITQHGLGGLKTGVRPSYRLVQDKTYYLGLLRTKITELNNEINVIGREAEQLKRDESASRLSGKRASDVALELKVLQQELGDYNTLFDKLNTNTEVEAVDWECRKLKQHNDRDMGIIEDLFAECREKEQQITTMESELEQEKTFMVSLVANMEPELKTKYTSLNMQSTSLKQQIETLQKKLDKLGSQKSTLEKSVTSYIKQDALNLLEKQQETEEKRNALLDEEANKGTPADERERLLKQVKGDNQEITVMERHIQELKDRINKTSTELQQLNDNIDSSQSEKNQQYVELRKREKVMDQFLDTNENIKETDTSRKSLLERNIILLLEKISNELNQFNQGADINDNSSGDDENDLNESESTVTTLRSKQQQLIASLSKVNQLESNMTQEMAMLNEKIKTMTEEMTTFKSLDKLKSVSNSKEKELIAERALLTKQQDQSKATLANLQGEHDAIKKELNDNEAFIQLTSLERKWQHLEQNNFALREFSESKKSETNYHPVVKDVLKQLNSYNRTLQTKYTSDT